MNDIVLQKSSDMSAWYDISRDDPQGEGVKGSEGILSSVGWALALGAWEQRMEWVEIA